MTAEKIKALICKINDYHITQKPQHGDNHWEKGAYFIGDLAAYEATGKRKYLDCALEWANRNEWRFSRDDEFKSINPDSKLCGQTYIELMRLNPGCGTWENMLPTLEYNFADSRNDYWWWIDSIYMALPFYSMYSAVTRDRRGYEKAHRLFVNTMTERKCFDKAEKLWYRDERFLSDKVLTKNGKKQFWSRGNGWVYAGIIRAISKMERDAPYRSEYISIVREMTEKITSLQSQDGLWRSSLLDPTEFDMPESSGTALFTYGLILGINIGILDSKYFISAQRGFEALQKFCLDENGKILWVQGVAWDPGISERDTTNDYAVGTMLLACSEFLKY